MTKHGNEVQYSKLGNSYRNLSREKKGINVQQFKKNVRNASYANYARNKVDPATMGAANQMPYNSIKNYSYLSNVQLTKNLQN